MPLDSEHVIRAGLIAEYRGARHSTTTDLLLAVMVDTTGPWTDLLADHGVGTYEDAAAALHGLPPRELVARPSQPPPRPRPQTVSVAARLVRLAIRVVTFVVATLRRRPPEGPLGRPPGSEVVQVVGLADSVAASADQEPGAGHVLVALCMSSGAHRWLMQDQRREVLAAARQLLRISSVGDRFTIWVHWPRRLIRSLSRRLSTHAADTNRPAPSRFAAAAVRLSLGAVLALLRFVVASAVIVTVYVVLWPATVALAGLRTVVALLTRSRIRIRELLWVVGGTAEVVATSGRRRIAVALLLPRALAFVVGTALITPFLLQVRVLGIIPLPVTVSRVDLLSAEFPADSGDPTGPGLLLVDAVAANGVARGLVLTTALGLLTLAIPAHREVENAIGHLLLARGVGAAVVRLPLTAIRPFVNAIESIESVLFLRGGPLYVTAGIVPLVAGAIVAVLAGAVVT